MFTDPVKNLKIFAMHEKDIVADLGAGTGFYSLLAAHMVPQGKVYAVEISKDFLEVIKNKIKDAGLKNIDVIWGNVEKKGGTMLGDQVIDRVIASNILFQVEDRYAFVEEIKRILKPKGRVLLVDWDPSLGEEKQTVKIKEAISKDKVIQMFKEHGFVLEREINAGEHHYGMILEKP